ncbi:sugar transferase [Novosphingobium sp. P6W]|uniref:sugar transferase n=1 Tax=Novosphingobium sp. P6W TaxID=1609758 RepID=UPI000AE89A0A|nr:sugar transferase [Novosphingobium sp. P6W]
MQTAKAQVARREATLHRSPGCSSGKADDQSLADWGHQIVMRAFDLAVSALALLLFLPLLLLVALAVRLTSYGPVLFVQQRIGRDGKQFPCLKFRSMVVDARERLETLLSSSEEARQEWARDQKLRSDPRITPIGRILRKTSLDELPQLLNVLFGHMSVVGPRPIVEGEVARYGHRFGAYCSVRPGLTGLWQVSGRNEVSYDTRVRLDAFYALRKSLVYDFAICLRTVPAVLASRGCY